MLPDENVVREFRSARLGNRIFCSFVSNSLNRVKGVSLTYVGFRLRVTHLNEEIGVNEKNEHRDQDESAQSDLRAHTSDSTDLSSAVHVASPEPSFRTKDHSVVNQLSVWIHHSAFEIDQLATGADQNVAQVDRQARFESCMDGLL